MKGVKLSGIGSTKPSKVLTNADVAKIVDTSDEWITSRTGIRSRHISSGETTIDLAIGAANKALKDANVDPSELGLIIVATITPDNMMPSTACSVQSAINAINATAFDISAACSGFVFASKIAVDAIRVGSIKKALVIGAEVLSKAIDWTDRNTCVLFGDGAGAVIYEESDINKILNIYTGSDGQAGNALKLTNMPVNNCLIKTDNLSQNFMSMEGREVYKFATSIVPICINKVMENTGYELSDIKQFILHQANERILDCAAKKMNLDKELFFKNLFAHGNTSAASIPIALDEAKVSLKSGDKIILVGFGGGLVLPPCHLLFSLFCSAVGYKHYSLCSLLLY